MNFTEPIDRHMPVGYLKIILGCMFSGKTSELIKEYRRWTSCGYECLVINHSSDNRYSETADKTCTHDGFMINSIPVGNKLFQFFKKESYLSRYDVVLINEGQFFDDLYEFTDYLVNKKSKKVYICGLNGDFQQRKFGSILDVIPLCDDLLKLSAICVNCKEKDGIFTYRLSDEKEQTVIGSSNYIPVCRRCYNNLSKKYLHNKVDNKINIHKNVEKDK